MQEAIGTEAHLDEAGAPSFAELVRTWARIGVLSFGGPTAQIAMMHKVIVDEKKWLTEHQYLNALNFCMLLPGPEAMQLATYSGGASMVWPAASRQGCCSSCQAPWWCSPSP